MLDAVRKRRILAAEVAGRGDDEDELDGYGAPGIDCLGEEGDDREALLWGCSTGPRRRRSCGGRRGSLCGCYGGLFGGETKRRKNEGRRRRMEREESGSS